MLRPGCSIWFARILLESRIRHAQAAQVSALVILDMAKACESVEHVVGLRKLAALDFPPHILSWILGFLTNRDFVCVPGKSYSRTFTQIRGLPQGSFLSPPLFNILMSSIPPDPEVTPILYSDDIAFFASSFDVQSL